MLQSAVPLQVLFIILKNLKDEDFDLDNDLQPVDRGYVDLNAGKASPEEADDAEETETGEDTLDADAHEGKED